MSVEKTITERNIELKFGNLSNDQVVKLLETYRSFFPSAEKPMPAKAEKAAPVEEAIDEGIEDFNNDIPDEEFEDESLEDEEEFDEEEEEKPKAKKKAKADPVEDGKAVIVAFREYFKKNGSKKAKAVLATLKIAKITECKPEQYAKALKLMK